MWYQFTIEYKLDSENSATDALSRRHEQLDTLFRATICMKEFNFLEDLRSENVLCDDFQELRKQIAEWKLTDSFFLVKMACCFTRAGCISASVPN